jgi:transketolase
MEQISKELRKLSLILSNKCNDGNLQSVFSCMDVLWVLYDKIMNWSVEKANDPDRDYFIISKGQATLALFPILIKKGMFTLEEMDEIGSFDSKFCIQTDVTKFEGGIENNAGSLGHGLPYAAGIASANKILKSKSQTFVLTGDGEFCEGTMWETCIYASTKKLDNLCVIVDNNNSAGAMVDIGNLDERLTSFGFDVYTVDGHDMEAINKIFNELDRTNGRPKAIIAKTVRGYGSPTMIKNDIWFHKAPNKDELEMLIKEVDEF